MLKFLFNYFGKKVFNRAVKTAAERVTRSTSDKTLQEIRTQTVRNLKYYASHPQAIEARLKELDQEWDTERAVEVGAAGLALASTTLGLRSNRKWFYVTNTVAGFLLQHSLQGWNPFLPVVRALKFRTRHEIDEEKFALKAIRGDFKRLKDSRKGPEEKAYKAYNAAAS